MAFVVRRRRARTVIAALVVLLPRRLRLWTLRRLLGHDIAVGANVGRAFVDVARLRVAAGATIGSLTVIRGCDEVVLAEEATIGPLNWINAVPSSSPSYRHQERHPGVVLGRGALISCLHFVDATDRVALGDFADLGGFGSQVLTHSVDLVRMRQHARPVSVGHHCLLGTRVTLLPGVDLPECSVLAAGSVLAPEAVQDSHRLYSGVPASAGRALNARIPFFHRASAVIE